MNLTNIIKSFIDLVDQQGDCTAIETCDRTISFTELHKLSDRLMDEILLLTKGKKTRIILYLNHTYQIIVAILAILKTGNVYIPVSLKANEERKKYIVECCRAELAITDQEFPYTEKAINLLNLSTDCDTNKKREYAKYDLEDETYILFTSGSTGEPKGCAISYGNLLYILNNMQHICPTGPSSAYCFSTPYTFDVSTTEIYGWIGGGKVVVCDTTEYMSYRDFCSIVASHKITHLAISPSGLANMFKMYSKPDLDMLASQLQFVMVAGEEFKKTIYDKWNIENWKFRLFNLYGPTEATVYALYYELEHNSEYENGIPLGGTLSGCEYIIDKSNSDGIGELVLIGDGVALGYINNRDEAKKRFKEINGKRSYRTGDLVSLKDGILFYHGRNDDQIQINGIRVELGEIEANMLALDIITDACVAVSGKKLISYICVKEGENIGVDYIRESLLKIMPRYMIPNYIRIVPFIPLNENRKSDRKKIAFEYEELLKTQKEEKEHVKTVVLNQDQQVLMLMVNTLCDKFDCTDMSIDDDFFEYGGDSLAAFTLASQLEDYYGICLDIDKIYLYKTAKKISEYIQNMNHSHKNNSGMNHTVLLNKLAELNQQVSEYLYNDSCEITQEYNGLYMQQAYFHNKFQSIISLDFDVGSQFSKAQLSQAIISLLDQNKILYSKLRTVNEHVFFVEYGIRKDIAIPYFEIEADDDETYISFLIKNYSVQIAESRYHNGFLSLFLIAKICQNYHIVGVLDHCVADAGCKSVIKRQLGNFLNQKTCNLTKQFSEYAQEMYQKNTIASLQDHEYIKCMAQYQCPDRETILNAIENKTCRVDIVNVPIMSTKEYSILVSYLMAKVVATRLQRNIAVAINYNCRDCEQYHMMDTVGDLHTVFSFQYTQGMKYEEYHQRAEKVIAYFGENFFQPFQACECNYPMFTAEQTALKDLFVNTRLLKVNFLGQVSQPEIEASEKIIHDVQKSLNKLLNAIYVTAYANKNTLVLFISKDILGGNSKLVVDFSEALDNS